MVFRDRDRYAQGRQSGAQKPPEGLFDDSFGQFMRPLEFEIGNVVTIHLEHGHQPGPSETYWENSILGPV